MTTSDNFCTNCGYNSSQTVSDPTMLKPGSVLLGKYVVGKVIGKGGFGVTYVAFDVTTQKKVAIKEYFPLRRGTSRSRNNYGFRFVYG